MNEYIIVTNDKQNKIIIDGLSTAEQVGDYLGISTTAVYKRLNSSQKNSRYKVIRKEAEVIPAGRNARYCKKYDMTHDRSEYFQQHYQKNRRRLWANYL